MGKSHQKGWVLVRGKKWYGYFRRIMLDPKTNQSRTASTPIALGLKSEMTKSEERKIASEIVRLSGQATEDGIVKNGTATLAGLSPHPLSTAQRGGLEEETAKVKRYLIQADLMDEFEEIRLENFDKFSLQHHLNKLAKTSLRIECCRFALTCGTSSPKQSIRTSSPGTLRASEGAPRNCVSGHNNVDLGSVRAHSGTEFA